MALKLLCAADLHIGRRPGRLPAPWSSGRISSARAWEELVGAAMAHDVDVVLLAGDVVDQDNRYFEAYGPLGSGVRRLKEAGIAVVAVAGNHDHESLHAVAEQVGAGHLAVLGRGGRWERWTLRDGSGRAVLHVDGWSFPASHHATDPTVDHDLELPEDGAPVVGLLHCDLISREPRYAPVTAVALARIPVAAWVLGHVHAPELREVPGRAPLLYPGSLLALDPGETGPRGAWLLELSDGRPPSFRSVPLSRVRYDVVDVDVSEIAERDELRGRVAGALRSHLGEVVAVGAGPLEVVSCRARLVGRTPLHARLERLLTNLEDLEPEQDGVRLVVERLVMATRPALDLEELARGSDAPGLLARLIAALDPTADLAPDPALDPDLIARAEHVARAVAGRSHYAGLEEAGRGGEEAGSRSPESREALRRQAMRLLDELVRQKEAV